MDGIRYIIEEILLIPEETYPRLFKAASKRIAELEAEAYQKGYRKGYSEGAIDLAAEQKRSYGDGWVDAMKQENPPEAKDG